MVKDATPGNGIIELSGLMDSTGGASGSPVFYKSEGNFNVVGVYSGARDYEPVATAIDGDSHAWLMGTLQRDGYYLDYDIV